MTIRIAHCPFVYRAKGVRQGGRAIRHFDVLSTVPVQIESVEPDESLAFQVGPDGDSVDVTGYVVGDRFFRSLEVSVLPRDEKAVERVPLTFEKLEREISLLRLAAREGNEITFLPRRSIFLSRLQNIEAIRYELRKIVHLLDGVVPDPIWTNEDAERAANVEGIGRLLEIDGVIHSDRWEPMIRSDVAGGRVVDLDLFDWRHHSGSFAIGSTSLARLMRFDRCLSDDVTTPVRWRAPDLEISILEAARGLMNSVTSWLSRRRQRARLLGPDVVCEADRALGVAALALTRADLVEAATDLNEAWERLVQVIVPYSSVPELAGLVVRSDTVDKNFRHLKKVMKFENDAAESVDDDMEALL